MVEKNKWILKDSEEERNERQQWQRKIDQNSNQQNLDPNPNQ